MDNLYNVNVKWTKDLDIEDALDYYEDNDHEMLYIILRKRKYKENIIYTALYIGMTYKQFLSDRLKNHHKLNNIIEEQRGKGEVVIRFGDISLPLNKRISEKLVKDIEAILIHEVQPEYNEMSRKSYRGREIKITNLRLGVFGVKDLPKVIDTTEWEFI